MSTLVLLSADDCHLCDHGKKLLAELAVDGLLSWREVGVDTEEGRRLELTAPPIRPVLYADGTVIGYGRLSAKRLRLQIARGGLSSGFPPASAAADPAVEPTDACVAG